MCVPVGCECDDRAERGWISTGRCVGRNGPVEEVPLPELHSWFMLFCLIMVLAGGWTQVD